MKKEKSPLRQKDIRTGAKMEREHILTLLEVEMQCPCEEPMQHLASLINGENR